MLLQIALDDISKEDAIVLIDKIKQEIDILELGTPFVFRYPISVIGELKDRYKDLKILADYKILDGGSYMANLAFEAGADIVTVSALAHRETIEGVIDSARKYGREVMVDMMAVPVEEIAKRTKLAEEAGAEYVYVHTSLDSGYGLERMESLKAMKDGGKKIKMGAAGGISLVTLSEVLEMKPDFLIVGGAILKSDKPEEDVHKFKLLMEAAKTDG